MKETDLYNEMKSYLPVCFDAFRVENAIKAGMPDVYLRHTSGKQFWLENKISNFNEMIDFTPNQLAFMYEHVYQFKGYALVLIRNRKKDGEYYLLDMNKISEDHHFRLRTEKFSPKMLLEISKTEGEFFNLFYDIKSVIEFIESLC